MKHSVLALAGPNGCGKTEWSLRLAKAINGAVIAADSRTVYRGLDIGTGKVTTEYPATWRKTPFGPMAMVDGIEHYGLDVVDPQSHFSVADYQEYVNRLLPNLWERRMTPMLVGGTGLYIDAVIRGFQLPVGTVPREDWEERSTEDLATQLYQLDPTTAANTDLYNRRRVERALAYHLATGKSFLSEQSRRRRDFDAAIFVIDRPREELYARIDARIERWIKSGLFEEVMKLMQNDVSTDRIHRFGQVYRAALKVVNQEWDIDEFRTRLSGELHAYARKQLTWWRRHDDVHWVSEYTEFEDQVKRWLSAR